MSKPKPADEKKKDEVPELPKMEIPNDTLTLEDKILRNNHEVVALKKDNRELRSKLKDLNNRLTETIDKLRLKNVQVEKTKEPTDPEEIHRREVINLEEQIALYKKEIEFLNQRNLEGGQIDSIKNLGLEVMGLVKKETDLTTDIKNLKTHAAVLGNRLKKLKENKEHTSKIKAMIDEKSLAERKIKSIRERLPEEAKMHEKQKDFMEKIKERYQEVCKSTNSKEAVAVDLDAKTGLYVIKYFDVDGKKKNKESWEPFICETPTTMTDPRDNEEFEILKKKVKNAFNSKRVEDKSLKIKDTKVDVELRDAEKAIAKLKQDLQEEDKLYDLLVDRIEQVNKESTQKKKLPPIKDVQLDEGAQKHGADRAFDPEARKMEIRISQTRANMKKIVDLKSLQEGTCIMIKVGKCEDEVKPGDRQLLGNNLKSRLTHLTMWIHLNDIIGLKGDYSPAFHYAQLAGSDCLENGDRKGVQRIDFDISAVKLKKVVSVFDSATGKLYSVEFTLRNKQVEKFGNQPDPLPEGLELETSTVNIPPYEHIKSITYYGERVQVPPGSPQKTAKGKQPVDRIEFTGFALEILP